MLLKYFHAIDCLQNLITESVTSWIGNLTSFDYELADQDLRCFFKRGVIWVCRAKVA